MEYNCQNITVHKTNKKRKPEMWIDSIIMERPREREDDNRGK